MKYFNCKGLSGCRNRNNISRNLSRNRTQQSKMGKISVGDLFHAPPGQNIKN